VEAQVRLAFDNLNAILGTAGCTFDDVIDVTVFIVDPESYFDTIWKLVLEYWGQRAASDADRRWRDVALWLRVGDQGDRQDS
jgi:enamine deaminase RidA (YjgF/YER057c/UK114 family)